MYYRSLLSEVPARNVTFRGHSSCFLISAVPKRPPLPPFVGSSRVILDRLLSIPSQLLLFCCPFFSIVVGRCFYITCSRSNLRFYFSFWKGSTTPQFQFLIFRDAAFSFVLRDLQAVDGLPVGPSGFPLVSWT
jgi:hypothetical protein